MAPSKTNVLFVVLDQMRADCLIGDLGDAAPLPNLRAFMDDAISFSNHVTVTSPCGPARVSLLTGQYAMNHNAVRNGTPLAHDKPNLAKSLRSGGYDPLLFGYTDTAADPRIYPKGDPILRSYEQVMPGFSEAVEMRFDDGRDWYAELLANGYELPNSKQMYVPDGPTIDAPARYAAEHSDTAYLTNRFLRDLPALSDGWCAHVTYIRPHPPFVAPAPYNKKFSPADMPKPIGVTNLNEARAAHPFNALAMDDRQISDMVVGFPDLQQTPENVATIRALYMGLAAEVDEHFGRIIAQLKKTGAYDTTMIIVTADHGEMLGDHFCWGKMNYYDAAFRTPLIIRLPQNLPADRVSGLAAGSVVDLPTESIDVTPTILDALGIEIPDSMDGRSLMPIIEGNTPSDWRKYTISEVDFGDPVKPTIWQCELGLHSTHCNLTVVRTQQHSLVHFNGGLRQMLFDHQGDGELRDIANDPGSDAIRLEMTKMLVDHRMTHAEGQFAKVMITSSGAVRGEY